MQIVQNYGDTAPQELGLDELKLFIWSTHALIAMVLFSCSECWDVRKKLSSFHAVKLDIAYYSLDTDVQWMSLDGISADLESKE